MNRTPDRTDNSARALRQTREAERRKLTEARSRAGRDARWRRAFRTARRAASKGLAHRLGPWLLRGLLRSWRLERIDARHFDDAFEQGAFVISFWHGQMLPIAPLHRGKGIAVLVSPSGDGDVVTGILERLGYRVIRGSISRRGTRAMREMRNLLRAGTPVCITPDGPRGPLHSMNSGPAWLARETGCPWVTMSAEAEPAIRLRSWDRFLIPKPRARVRVVYEAPVRIQPDASDLDLEHIAATQRKALIDSSTDSQRILGVPDAFPESETPASPAAGKRHQK